MGPDRNIDDYIIPLCIRRRAEFRALNENVDPNQRYARLGVLYATIDATAILSLQIIIHTDREDEYDGVETQYRFNP